MPRMSEHSKDTLRALWPLLLADGEIMGFQKWKIKRQLICGFFCCLYFVLYFVLYLVLKIKTTITDYVNSARYIVDGTGLCLMRQSRTIHKMTRKFSSKFIWGLVSFSKFFFYFKTGNTKKDNKIPQIDRYKSGLFVVNSTMSFAIFFNLSRKNDHVYCHLSSFANRGQ